MKRYQQLLQVIDQVKPNKIIEIGTHQGNTGLSMCTQALKHADWVHYEGVDLFEDVTPEINEIELNVKPAAIKAEVSAKFQKLKEQTGNKFSFHLTKANTREIKELPEADFVFVDGGHSVETIAHDYSLVDKSKAIVIDDYYVKDGEDKCPDVERYGCNKIIQSLGSAVSILPQADPVVGGGLVAMACVGFKPAIKRPLKIKTKNSKPDEEIQKQVAYAVSKGFREIQKCRQHTRRCIFVSAGPTYKSQLGKIRKLRDEGGYLVCVKHSHDWLIANGIVPDACVLLDPRIRVRENIENPHPDVLYYVASQVCKEAIDNLESKGAKIVLYHAKVGAGEEKHLDGKIMVLGGSTSATRGISLFHALGFRFFDLFGYDSCYTGPVDMNEKKDDGKPRYFQVSVHGREFMTDAELTAQAMDAEKLFQMDIGITCHGDGMIPHLHDVMSKNITEFREWENAV